MIARIPAEPYPFALEPGSSALLVIDMQRDFLEPGGFGAVTSTALASGPSMHSS
jgi:hypothetical protein